MSMTVALRPVSLWTHAMFAVLADLEKSGLRIADLTRDSSADILGANSSSGGICRLPRQRGRGSMRDTSRQARRARVVGYVVRRMEWCREHDLGHLPPRGRVFPPDWLSNHINQKDMHGLYHLLRQFRTLQPGHAAVRQVLIDVNSPSVVSAFNRGRAKNRETHAFPGQFWDCAWSAALDYRPSGSRRRRTRSWISRPSRNATIRIATASVQAVWDEIGPFDVGLVAGTASVLRSPLTGRRTCWRATFRSFWVTQSRP